MHKVFSSPPVRTTRFPIAETAAAEPGRTVRFSRLPGSMVSAKALIKNGMHFASNSCRG